MTSKTPLQTAVRTAIVAGTFSLVVCAVLLYDFSQRRAKDPLEVPAYQELKLALKVQPASEVLKEGVRAMDQRLREEYFRQRAFALLGAGLLCAAVAVFLVAIKSAATIQRERPMPQPTAATQDHESQWTPMARGAVAGLLTLLAGTAIVLSFAIRSPLPEDVEEIAEAAPEVAAVAKPQPIAVVKPEAVAVVKPEAASDDNPQPAAVTNPGTASHPTPRPVAVATPGAGMPAASEDEIRRAWPRFRGPDGSGISPYDNVPDTWDAATGKNILWKTPVPLPGNGSPVVCGKRVFLSGADNQRRQVYCFDAVTGALLWQQDVPSTPQSSKPVKVTGDTGFASCTPATDGHVVAAVFANGDLAAFDYSGKLAWSQSFGIPENTYGHAASLAVYKDMLLVPMDQGAASAGRSKLLALDMATGKTVWQKSRPVGASWTTPIVIRGAGQDQVITTANPWVIAYDPKDGTEIWRAKCLQGDVAPSPVFAGGMVFASANDAAPLSAIKVDGKGDVTATHVVWKGEDNLPDTSSPLATDDAVYVVTSSGMVTSYDAKKGDKRWEEDLGNLKFKASPSLVGNRLYLLDEEGKGLILEPSRDKCKKAGTMNMGEPCVASPAFQDGRIYIRGEKSLFCIAKTEGKS